ncbi:MAG: lamin tail domain-containing protein [Bacteroidota bacterium]
MKRFLTQLTTIAVLLLFCVYLGNSQVIINEFYADVATTLKGDANGDGIRSARDDEFIELFNRSQSLTDISGFQLLVGNDVKHTFSDSTFLAPTSFLVIFGGGLPTGIFGNSTVFTASSGSLGLGNAGATIILQDKQGIILDSISYSGDNIDASLVRKPDILGTKFVPHDEVSDAFGTTYSPGTLVSSFPFNDGQKTLVHFNKTSGTSLENSESFDVFLNLINPKPQLVEVVIDLTAGSGTNEDLANFFPQTVSFPVNSISQRRLTVPISNDTLFEGNETFVLTITEINDPDSNAISINDQFELTIFDDDFDLGLELTEILADPPTGIEGDANQDGERDAKADEFLEFRNITDQTIDLTGMHIDDSEAIRHRIPDSTILQPDQLLVVFGGGTITDTFGTAIVQTASTKDLSLANRGDQIIIRDSLDNVVFFYEYGEIAGENQSVTFCSGEAVLHSEVEKAILSPGRLTDCEERIVHVDEVLPTEITIYPNPATHVLYFDHSAEISIRSIQLFSSQGRELIRVDNQSHVDLPILPKGVYWVKMETNRGFFVKKVLLLP